MFLEFWGYAKRETLRSKGLFRKNVIELAAVPLVCHFHVTYNLTHIRFVDSMVDQSRCWTVWPAVDAQEGFSSSKIYVGDASRLCESKPFFICGFLRDLDGNRLGNCLKTPLTTCYNRVLGLRSKAQFKLVICLMYCLDS